MSIDTISDVEDEILTSNIEKDILEPIQGIPRKRFIGGYRNNHTGLIYHHATVQTTPSPWKYSFVERFHRDAQTVVAKENGQQTPKDACTQVEAPSIYIRTTNDKSLEASEDYICIDDIKKNEMSKLVVIQKHIKRWLAYKELLRRKKEALLQALWDKEQTECKTKQDEEWMKNLQKRRIEPQTEEDFRLIFSDIQKWWRKEAKSIANARSGADLKAAMWMLVNAEAKKIEEIDRKKNMTGLKKWSSNREKLLNMAAQPKIWKAYHDKIEVETDTTHRARCLHNLYQTLSMRYLSPQDRVDALRRMKEILQPYRSKLTDSLLQLANREIDLHLRGIKSSTLTGLQDRIRDLFYQFAKKPVFNPEMQKVTKIDRYSGSPFIWNCSGCKNFYISASDSKGDDGSKSVSESYFKKCKRCLNTENQAWIRKDLEFHKRILKLLIFEEERQPTKSSLLYILQPNDIGHVVDLIWKHQSCISGSKNDHELELIRYDVDRSWTPWNCLLVTRQEAVTLSSIPNSENKYDEKFRGSVFQKHAAAKQHFSTIPRFLPYLEDLCSA